MSTSVSVSLPEAVCLLGAVVAMMQAGNALRRMSHSTDHIIRLAHVLICAGSFGEIGSIFTGHTPGVAECLFVSGVGLLSLVDRRVLRCPLDDPKSPYYQHRVKGDAQ